MWLRADDIIGLPALRTGDTKIYGKVSNVLWAPDTKRVAGFQIVRSGFLHRSVTVSFSAIISATQNVLLFRGEEEPFTGFAMPLPTTAKDLQDGRQIRIKDIAWDAENGQVQRLYVSKGFFEDVRQGLTSASCYVYRKDEKDILLLPDTEYEEGMQ